MVVLVNTCDREVGPSSIWFRTPIRPTLLLTRGVTVHKRGMDVVKELLEGLDQDHNDIDC